MKKLKKYTNIENSLLILSLIYINKICSKYNFIMQKLEELHLSNLIFWNLMMFYLLMKIYLIRIIIILDYLR